MNPVATSDAAFRGGACPTPEYTIAYTGNYTTSADANKKQAPSFVDNGIISGVPCNIKLARNTRYRQMIQHDGS